MWEWWKFHTTESLSNRTCTVQTLSWDLLSCFVIFGRRIFHIPFQTQPWWLCCGIIKRIICLEVHFKCVELCVEGRWREPLLPLLMDSARTALLHSLNVACLHLHLRVSAPPQSCWWWEGSSDLIRTDLYFICHFLWVTMAPCWDATMLTSLLLSFIDNYIMLIWWNNLPVILCP